MWLGKIFYLHYLQAVLAASTTKHKSMYTSSGSSSIPFTTNLNTKTLQYSSLPLLSNPLKLNISRSFSPKKPSTRGPLVTPTSDWYQQEEENTEPTLEDAKVFIGNLPYDADSEILAKLFEQAGVVEIAEVIYNKETYQSRGFGFVTMSTAEEADKAINMFKQYELKGRILTVNKASSKGSRPEKPRHVYTPTYSIYVSNLAWSVDNARLEQIFREYGRVVDVRVIYDRENGRSRGFGFVTMSTKAELNDAVINLNGKNLGGREINVVVAEERPRHVI